MLQKRQSTPKAGNGRRLAGLVRASDTASAGDKVRSERCQAALAALHGPALSEDERRHYDQQRAEEMARAKRRRVHSPQLELGDGG